MHVLPQLRELDSRYGDQLAIVGVHSGKYTAERETPRIRDASIRLGALHPIVNDRQFRIWRSYAVRAWPTLVAIDQRGYVVGMQAGEFTAKALVPFIDRVIASASVGDGAPQQTLHFAAEAPTHQTGQLAFPGKVTVNAQRIAIADSGNHRVLTGTLDDAGTTMRVSRTLGGNQGYRDGAAPLFDNPQGLAFAGDRLLVADAGNHVIREIALSSGETRTLAGTGRQIRSAVDEAQGSLSSPWDLAVSGDLLYVAMAGVHQLWTVSLATGESAVFSGSGAEDLHDGPHAQAALAQPMGLCLSDDAIWFVDPESSAVRMADRDPDGGVHTITGTGLFDFGDVDGAGDEVRMQHQQGIARARDGRLLVCDSYNDALKWVDPVTRRAETWVRGFSEPAGLAVGERYAYVADTNAHRIAVVELATGAVRPLILDGDAMA